MKYLAKVVLNINIQEGNHDSNEDARTALELYYKYLEFWKKNHYSMKSTNPSKTSTDCCECFPIDDSKGYI